MDVVPKYLMHNLNHTWIQIQVERICAPINHHHCLFLVLQTTTTCRMLAILLKWSASDKDVCARSKALQSQRLSVAGYNCCCSVTRCERERERMLMSFWARIFVDVNFDSNWTFLCWISISEFNFFGNGVSRSVFRLMMCASLLFKQEAFQTNGLYAKKHENFFSNISTCETTSSRLYSFFMHISTSNKLQTFSKKSNIIMAIEI